ncbi:MAG: hypothetical protein ACKO1Q_05320 [Vulcanococcus sp.]
MNPLPDRTVIIGMVATLGLVFALVFWFVRLNPSHPPELQWRDSPPSRPAPARPLLPGKPSNAALI